MIIYILAKTCKLTDFTTHSAKQLVDVNTDIHITCLGYRRNLYNDVARSSYRRNIGQYKENTHTTKTRN